MRGVNKIDKYFTMIFFLLKITILLYIGKAQMCITVFKEFFNFFNLFNFKQVYIFKNFFTMCFLQRKETRLKFLKQLQKKKIFGLRKKITLKHFKKNQLFAIVQKYDKQFERSFYMFDAVSFKFLQKQKKYEVRTKNFFFFNVAKWSILNYYNFNFFFLNSICKSYITENYKNILLYRKYTIFFFCLLHKKLGGYLKIVQSKLTYKCNSQLFLASTYSTFTVFSVKKVSFFLDKFFFDVHCTASVNLGYMEQVDQFVTPKVATALSLDSAQVFSAYFAKFSTFFFLNFTFDGVALSKMLRLNLRMLSFLLFLPDNFLFIQYLGVYFNNTKFRIKYNNIVPIFNIDLKLIFKKKKIFFFKKNHIFLWYLSNFFESKLQKPFFLKILYARAAFNARFIYTICLHIFKKFRRYMFRFKRNFFLGEIIRVVALSLFSKDPTLFLNCILWVLLHIPYRDVKPFLYFLKVLLKRHLLPAFKKLFKIRGFIFDIRGKVGVTGDAKKRHTLILWGQSSFSRKDLKLSLKHGLAYTRTGVMGVTVIIIF